MAVINSFFFVVKRANLMAASMASVPELQRKARLGFRHDRQEPFEKAGAGVVVEGHGATDQLPGLFINGFNDPFVAVANIRHAVAADTVDILFAIDIPDLGTYPADEDKVALRVDVELVGLLQLYKTGHWMIVPFPLSAS
jgi:hypothetical protein